MALVYFSALCSQSLLLSVVYVLRLAQSCRDQLALASPEQARLIPAVLQSW